jgi:hypothetical protein
VLALPGLGAVALIPSVEDVVPALLRLAPLDEVDLDVDPKLLAGVSPGLLADVSPGLLADVSPGLLADVSPGLLADVSPGLLTDVSPALLADVDVGPGLLVAISAATALPVFWRLRGVMSITGNFEHCHGRDFAHSPNLNPTQ